MRALVQRVAKASVVVDGVSVGAIGAGLLVFLGIKEGDTSREAKWLAEKVANLRIFSDLEGKFNLSLIEEKGQVLVVSQFTLYGDSEKGRRPSFIQAAPPEVAQPLYVYFIEVIQKKGISVAQGVFGAKMEVSLVNDGPVTLWLER